MAAASLSTTKKRTTTPSHFKTTKAMRSSSSSKSISKITTSNSKIRTSRITSRTRSTTANSKWKTLKPMLSMSSKCRRNSIRDLNSRPKTSSLNNSNSHKETKALKINKISSSLIKTTISRKRRSRICKTFSSFLTRSKPVTSKSKTLKLSWTVCREIRQKCVNLSTLSTRTPTERSPSTNSYTSCNRSKASWSNKVAVKIREKTNTTRWSTLKLASQSCWTPRVIQFKAVLWWVRAAQCAVWSMWRPTQKYSTFCACWRSIGASVKSKATIVRRGNQGQNLTNCLRKRRRDSETIFVLHKSKSCKILRRLRRPSFWNSLKLGTTTWATMKPQRTCPWKS